MSRPDQLTVVIFTASATVAAAVVWNTQSGPQLKFPSTVSVTAPLDEESIAVAFAVENDGRQPVDVLGAETGCGCLTVANLPSTIDPGRAETILATIDGPFGEKRDESITLFTSDPGVSLDIKFKVSPAEPKASGIAPIPMKD